MKRLHGHHRLTPAQLLAEASRWCDAHDVSWDSYGAGAVVEDFEAHVAALLGFEAARFFPSGTMAQGAALRVWSERAGNDHVGMHCTSHLERHEERGYAHLHRLRATLVGPAERPVLAQHLEAIHEALSVLLIELPIRDASSQLPSWDELTALKRCARERGVRLHLDGARLWTCAAFYDRSYAEICEGFDSVYVSFYKDIGALPGSMLLGPRGFIDACKVWQRRMGGNLHSVLPNVVTARVAMDARLPLMRRYVEHARAVAAAIDAVEGVEVMPNPPHTNMFHVLVPLPPGEAMAARERVAGRHGVWLFGSGREGWREGTSRLEVWIGDAALEVDPAEAALGFRALLV